MESLLVRYRGSSGVIPHPVLAVFRSGLLSCVLGQSSLDIVADHSELTLARLISFEGTIDGRDESDQRYLQMLPAVNLPTDDHGRLGDDSGVGRCLFPL